MTPAATGLARTTDPETSHQATDNQTAVSHLLRWSILEVLAEPGAQFDDDVISSMLTMPHTPSGASTRRKELVDLRLVEPVGYGRNIRDRKVILWSATDEGRAFLRRGSPDRLGERFLRYRETRNFVSSALPPPTPTAHETASAVLTHLVQAIMDDDQERIERALERAVTVVRWVGGMLGEPGPPPNSPARPQTLSSQS